MVNKNKLYKYPAEIAETRRYKIFFWRISAGNKKSHYAFTHNDLILTNPNK